MTRFAFHTDTYEDLAEHWECAAEHRTIDAADRVVADIFNDALDRLFPHSATHAPTSRTAHFAFTSSRIW